MRACQWNYRNVFDLVCESHQSPLLLTAENVPMPPLWAVARYYRGPSEVGCEVYHDGRGYSVVDDDFATFGPYDEPAVRFILRRMMRNGIVAPIDAS